MNKQTPKRASLNANSGFSPITLRSSPATNSPQRNLTGPPRIIKDIIADLFNNIQRWNSVHIKGAAVVKQITSLIENEVCRYTPQLDECMNTLNSQVDELTVNKETFELLITQTQAFAKLPNGQDPVFLSLDASSITSTIARVCQAYIEEFKTKQLVLENIAHAKSKHDAMFFACLWTYQLGITDNVTRNLEALLVDSGHRLVR